MFGKRCIPNKAENSTRKLMSRTELLNGRIRVGNRHNTPLPSASKGVVCQNSYFEAT
jgi:hypothetical protein